MPRSASPDAVKIHPDDDGEQPTLIPPPVSSQLLAYVTVALFGYIATSKLVPHIKVCIYLLYIFYVQQRRNIQ